MGLDMYLYGVQYRSRFENDVNKTQIVHTQEVYWRKADMIHHWFVENVQDGYDDCKTYEVSDTQLLELIDTCKDVIQNPEKASTTLVTDYEYDDVYFKELKRTIREITHLLAQNYDWYSYASSW